MSETKPKRVWLDRQEAADYLGVSKSTLYRWTQAKIIECYAPTATRVLYDPDVLEEFIESRIRPAWRKDRDKNRRAS